MSLNDAKLPDDVHFGLRKLLRADATNDTDCGHTLVQLPQGEFNGLDVQTVGTTQWASRRDLAEWLLGRIDQ